MAQGRTSKEINEAKQSAYKGSSSAGWRNLGIPEIKADVHTEEFYRKRNQRVQNVTQRNRKPASSVLSNLKQHENLIKVKIDAMKKDIADIDLTITGINSAPLPASKFTGRYYGHGIPIMSSNDADNELRRRSELSEPLYNKKRQLASEEQEYESELQKSNQEKAKLKELQRQEFTNMTGDQTLEAGRSRSALSGSRSSRPTRPRNIISIQNNQSDFKTLGV